MKAVGRLARGVFIKAYLSVGILLVPYNSLKQKAREWDLCMFTEKFALCLDRENPLREFRRQFIIPKKRIISKSEGNLNEP